MLDISESGSQIAEKLIALLDGKQQKDLAEYIFHNLEPSISAVKPPCVTTDPMSTGYADQPLTEIREGDLYFCLEEREVSVREKKVDLSAREFNALYLLLVNRKRVMTFETIFCHVWGEEYVENELTAIHNIMSRLRQKLKISPDIPDYIISVRGVGYKFDTTQQKK